MSTGVQHQHEVENAWAGQGAVLLDIGGEIGALVVTMPDALEGIEVEIEAASGHHDHSHQHGHHRDHVAVVSRPVLAGAVASLVFPELREGRYRLFAKGEDEVRMEVEVVGAKVTTVAWTG